jgi:hypothetical protein
MSSDDGSMAAFQYWMYKAHTQTEAVALASRLNLDIPQGMTYGFKGGLGYAIFPLICSGAANFLTLTPPLHPLTSTNTLWSSGSYPIRRLVVTGEDNPTNFAILFGPQWEIGMADLWGKTRIEVLLCPRSGSPAHMMAGAYDEGCPVWRPRGPSEEEDEVLRRVAGMSRLMERIDRV